jgi:hypothetical protein
MTKQPSLRFKLNTTSPDGLATERYSNRQEAYKAFTAAKLRLAMGTVELFDTWTTGGLLRIHKTPCR